MLDDSVSRMIPEEKENYSFPPPAEGTKNQIWEKVGKWAVYAVIFLTPIFFLPFTQAQVEINKFIFVSIAVLVGLVAFFADVIEKRSVAYPKSLLSLAVLGVVAAYGVSTIFSIAPATSLYGNLTQPDSFLNIVIYALAFFLSFYFLRREDIKMAGSAFLLSMAVLTVIGLLQVFSVFVFPASFARNSGFNPMGTVTGWGIFMALTIVMAAAAAFRKLRDDLRTMRGKVILGSALLSAIGLIVLNFQFLWLSAAFLIIVIAAMRFVSRDEFSVPLIMVIFALFLALISSRLPAMGSVPIEIRPNVGATWTIAKGTLAGSRIVTGSGPSTFTIDFLKNRDAGLNSTNFWNVRFAQGHDFLLTELATVGVLGILSLLFLIFAFIRQVIGALESEEVGMIVAATLFLLLSWFLYPGFLSEMIFIFIGFGFMLSLSGARRELSFEHLPRLRAFGIFLGILVLTVATLAGIYGIGQKYAAAAYYGHAVNLTNAGKVSAAIAPLNTAVGLETNSDEYWRGASQIALLQARQSLQDSGGSVSAQVQSFIVGAVAAAQKAASANQNDSINWNNLGSIYESLIPVAKGADNFAEASYRKAAELDPQNPQAPVDVARILIMSSDLLRQSGASADSWKAKLNDAEGMLNKSLALKGDYATPRFLLAQLYLREGNAGKAIARVEEIKTQDPFNAGLAFQLGLLYYQNNQIDQAQGEFGRAVAIDDNYSNARYFLGLIYDGKGQKPKALEQFQKIAKLNPGNAEVQRILDNLNAGRSALSSVSPPAPPPEKRTDVPVNQNKENVTPVNGQ